METTEAVEEQPRVPDSVHDPDPAPAHARSSKRPACRECRARKVGCDRDGSRCGPCIRFELTCSYSASHESEVDLLPIAAAEPASDARVTQAGLARRRIRRACRACRALKSRCSGDLPCVRCRSHSLSCDYQPHAVPRFGRRGRVTRLDLGSPDATATETPSLSEPSSRPTPTPVAVPTQSSSRATVLDPVRPVFTSVSTPSKHPNHHQYGPQTGIHAPFYSPNLPHSSSDLTSSIKKLTDDASRVQKDLQAFFDRPDPSPQAIQFLHRPSVLADWSQGRLDPSLTATLCALGRLYARQASLLQPYNDAGPEHDLADTREARTWLGKAQDVLIRSHGTDTMVQLQILILIIQYSMASRDVMDAWNLVSLAARLAFTLRLNYELPGCDLNPVVQETRRRMIWSIWLVDRLLASGIEDLVVCPTERIHTRLPCDDYTFQQGIASRAEPLTAYGRQGETAGHDTMGYYLRLLDCRHRILKYTKRVIRESASPINTSAELSALQSDLTSLASSLPSHLKLTPEQLRLKAHSLDAGEYIALHMLWHQCHCDLYRFLVPGMREAVKEEIFKSTPTEYVIHCQSACLLAAICATDLLAELYRLGFRTNYNIPNLSVGIYQIAQILYNLQSLLQPDGGGPRSMDTLQGSLRDAHRMVCTLQPSARLMPKTTELLDEADSLIHALGHDAPPPLDLGRKGPHSVHSAAPPNPSQDPWPDSAHHLASKGSFLDAIKTQMNMEKPSASSATDTSYDTSAGLHTDHVVGNASPSRRLHHAPEEEASFEMQGRERPVTLQNSLENTAPRMTTGSREFYSSMQQSPGQRQPIVTDHPWDPFEVQLWDYDYSELETILSSFSSV